MIKAGVVGWPIQQSKSPIIHTHWLKSHGIEGTYKKISIQPDEFPEGIQNLLLNGYAGVNVTAPHKENALLHADSKTERAEQIGAANTLVFKAGKILADNTDGEGFISNLIQNAPNWNVGSGPALVLGAGGAARAVLQSLLQAGVPEIILANRTRVRAEALANHFGQKIMVADWADAQLAVGSVSTLVNTTSLGMLGKDDLEFDVSGVSKNCLVTDIVYNPLETTLLKNAREKGCTVVDGLGMLLHQAVPGFEMWFGARPMVDNVLRKKVLEEL